MKGVFRAFALAGSVAAAGASCQTAAKPIGSVAISDATVTNASKSVVEISGGRAELVGSSTVTAKNRTAAVSLTRGGEVRVCQTSGLHLTQSNEGTLLLALDRGAMEIRMKATAGDIVMTPDLRFAMQSAGSLDLRMRVTRNGDTCVEHRGHNAPILRITDVFGEASYELKPGQHVLFEHGSLREVVDRETTPCGCPPDERPGIPIADAALRGGSAAVTPEQVEAAHPFPAAVSEGLAPPSPLPAEAPGGTHVQVASTLSYDPNAKTDLAAKDVGTGTASLPVPTVEPVLTGSAQVAQRTGKSKGGPFRAVGRFFKRLFVR